MYLQCSIDEDFGKWSAIVKQYPLLDTSKTTLLLLPTIWMVYPELQRVESLYLYKKSRPRESKIEFTSGSLEARHWCNSTKMELSGTRYECIIVHKDCDIKINDLLYLCSKVRPR